jgi:uncharacterized protein YkwD
VILAAALTPVLSDGSVLAALSATRQQGCDGKPGLSAALARDAALDGVALDMARGTRLADAIEDAHFHARLSASLAVADAADVRALSRAITERFCTEILNADFRRVGIAVRGQDTWIVLATLFDLPRPQDAPAIRRHALELVNRARSQARKCGSVAFAAARPLVLDALLDQAALGHSLDMAQHSHMGHPGSDGSTVAQRVSRVGYVWRKVGENVAANAPSAEEVVQGWTESPTHCANLMNPDFTAMGIGYAVNPASEDGIYWTQVFATPR